MTARDKASKKAVKPYGPRVDRLRLGIASHIPKFPNTKKTLNELQHQSLGVMLIHYFNWRSRFVGVRPRSVEFVPGTTEDIRWRRNAREIDRLLGIVSSGHDLSPYLSTQIHTRGYTSSNDGKIGNSKEKWIDKDFILNATGLHHFHLKPVTGRGQDNHRTDLLILAKVTYNEFLVFGLFDHSVFRQGSSENERLLDIYHRHTMNDVPPNTVVIDCPITNSGHALHVVTYASFCAERICGYDDWLYKPDSTRQLFSHAGIQLPKRPKFRWHLSHLDLLLFEKTSNTYFELQKGWN